MAQRWPWGSQITDRKTFCSLCCKRCFLKIGHVTTGLLFLAFNLHNSLEKSMSFMLIKVDRFLMIENKLEQGKGMDHTLPFLKKRVLNWEKVTWFCMGKSRLPVSICASEYRIYNIQIVLYLIRSKLYIYM